MSEDAISVDELLGRIFAYGIDWQEFKDTSDIDHGVSTFAGKIKAEMKDELQSQLHSLLISKLLEKQFWAADDAYDAGDVVSVDDIKAVLDELFGVDNER